MDQVVEGLRTIVLEDPKRSCKVGDTLAYNFGVGKEELLLTVLTGPELQAIAPSIASKEFVERRLEVLLGQETAHVADHESNHHLPPLGGHQLADDRERDPPETEGIGGPKTGGVQSRAASSSGEVGAEVKAAHLRSVEVALVNPLRGSVAARP